MVLVAYVLFTLLLGTTEAGRLATEVRAVAALAGGFLVAGYLWLMPRRHDVVDVLILAALLAFLLTCVTSSAPRASFDAATTAVAYAAAFYLARGVFADEACRRLAFTLMGLIGVVIGVLYLLIWGTIWVRWTVLAGAPPLDLNLPAALYQHRYLVGMLAAMLLPATVVLARRPRIWPVGVIGTGATGAVAFMSGGRTVWIAGIAAVVVTLAIAGGLSRIGSWRRWWRVLLAGLCVVALVLMAVPILARMGATSTIELRVTMWWTALDHWLQSAVVGFGPGSFAGEFATTGYQGRYDIDVPHAHNALVQALFEGGLLGAFGLALVCVAFIVGVARAGHAPWSAAVALAFIAFASVTDNPTTVPFLVVVAIVWAALAVPRVAAQENVPRGSLRIMTFASAAIAAIAVMATLGGAWAFDRARDAAGAGDRPSVVSNLRLATALDPAFPLYHRELGVSVLPTGRTAEAIHELEVAAHLNPGDGEAVRALAVLYARSGERAEALAIAGQLISNQGARLEDVLTAAYVRDAVGNGAGGKLALVRAVQIAPWVTSAPEWRRVFPKADVSQTLLDAHRAWDREPSTSTRMLTARAWLAAMVGATSPETSAPALQLQAAVIGCRMSVAQSLMISFTSSSATEVEALRGQLMFAHGFQRAPDVDLIALLAMRDPTLPGALIGRPEQPSRAFYDASTYGRRTLARPAVLALPTAAGGMGAWLRDPAAASASGAPTSPIAQCE
jgi:O-antigen ligase